MNLHGLDERTFRSLQRLMRERAGIGLTEDRRAIVAARLAGALVRRGIEDPAAWLREELAAQNPRAEEIVVEALLVGETFFFRDARFFRALREEVLPELIEGRRGARSLRAWCAACSSGQEVWSLAMLLRDGFPELESWDVRILGTDLSDEALARAREGRYTSFETNRGLPARLLTRFFRKERSLWCVDETLRRGVEFRRLNLARPLPPLPPFDLILLRNVLIYMPTEVRAEVVERVASRLAPGGRLFLGHAEMLPEGVGGLRRVGEGGARAYRRDA